MQWPSFLVEWTLFEWGGIKLGNLAFALTSILLGLLARKISDRLFSRRIIPWLEQTPLAIDDLLAKAGSKPMGFLFPLLGFHLAAASLPMEASPGMAQGLQTGLRFFGGLLFVWFLFRLGDVSSSYFQRKVERSEPLMNAQIIPLIRKVLRSLVCVLGGIWIIQLMGFEVSSLLAGLGIGGLAVALALQDTLANFFGSFFILIDRPFQTGDWIKVGDVEGIVQDVGFRTTKIRTFLSSMISIPNKTMADSTIDNFSRMAKRRVIQTVGVTYSTTADQMECLVERIRRVLEADQEVDQEVIVVRFSDFGDSSLNLFLLYFTKGLTLAEHLETKERINLAILRLVDELNLEIAFPTRTIHIAKEETEIP